MDLNVILILIINRQLLTKFMCSVDDFGLNESLTRLAKPDFTFDYAQFHEDKSSLEKFETNFA